jgi:hypothetical protein
MLADLNLVHFAVAHHLTANGEILSDRILDVREHFRLGGALGPAAREAERLGAKTLVVPVQRDSVFHGDLQLCASPGKRPNVGRLADMHDSDNDDSLWLRDKKHHVREAAQEGPADAWAHLSICVRNAGDGGEGGIARTDEVGAEPWLPLLIPSKRRVHFERGGGKDSEGKRPKVHSGAAELVSKDSLPHLFPAEGAFAALVEILDATIELGEERRRHREVRRRSLDGDGVPDVLDKLEPLGNGQPSERFEVDGGLAHVRNLSSREEDCKNIWLQKPVLVGLAVPDEHRLIQRGIIARDSNEPSLTHELDEPRNRHRVVRHRGPHYLPPIIRPLLLDDHRHVVMRSVAPHPVLTEPVLDAATPPGAVRMRARLTAIGVI